MNHTSSSSASRTALWDWSALVYAQTYDLTAHTVDTEVLDFFSRQILEGVVLDAGCGPGVVTRKLLARGAATVVALDISERMLIQLPRDPRCIPVLGPLSETSVQMAAFDHAPRGFDLVLFKRSLYLPEHRAVDVLAAAYETLAPHGAIVIVQPEASLRRYAFEPGRPLGIAPHTFYHMFNRWLSNGLLALGIHDYRAYTAQGLQSLAARACPDAAVAVLPSSQRAFNVVIIRRRPQS